MLEKPARGLHTIVRHSVVVNIAERLANFGGALPLREDGRDD
jgi:hypothetical protein